MKKFCVIYIKKKKKKLQDVISQIERRILPNSEELETATYFRRRSFPFALFTDPRTFSRDEIDESTATVKVVRRLLSPDRDDSHRGNPPRKHLALPTRRALFFPSYFFVTFHFAFHWPPPSWRTTKAESVRPTWRTGFRLRVSARLSLGTVDPISGPRLATYIEEERSTERWKNPSNENTSNLSSPTFVSNSSRNESRFVRSFLNLNQQRQGGVRRRRTSEGLVTLLVPR